MPLPDLDFKNHQIFDPWNSSSTGHQRAENPYSNTTTWKTTRSEKLSTQFRYRDCNSSNTSTSTSDGNKSTAQGRGEWKWMDEKELKRTQLGCQDIRSFMAVGKKRAAPDSDDFNNDSKKKTKPEPTRLSSTTPQSQSQSHPSGTSKTLTGTTIYINGSTMPQISDHKLKHLLLAHGANISISLARKTVTHVIVGTPNAGPGKGAGGGLAATKLQSEIERCKMGVKVVGVEWALESIKAEKRLAEGRFALNLAPKGQRSVMNMLKE